MNAQRCAVLEFKAGSGISQADVDGISGIFITYFRPAGYTMVERTQIDKAIDEQGFQRSRMTESQMVRIGRILNVSKIVIGDVNVVMGQYNVDARVINVESGTIAATEGATFTGSSYRSTMQSLAQKLAGKIAITSGGTVNSASSNTQQRNEPYIIYGYLKVFPNDLGSFDSKPTQTIARINQSQQYGYGTWRLPTNEELQLMRAKNIVGDSKYMTLESPSGNLRLVTDKQRGEVMSIPEGYVDLGLPSGTIWKDKNENGFYRYQNAVDKFGSYLPTKQQWFELINNCTWNWTGNGFQVIGSNGKSIFLPAEGDQPGGYSPGIVTINPIGFYWTSTKDYSNSTWDDKPTAWEVYITGDPNRTNNSEVDFMSSDRRSGLSVRLVR